MFIESGQETKHDIGLPHIRIAPSRNSYLKWYVSYIVEQHSSAEFVFDIK